MSMVMWGIRNLISAVAFTVVASAPAGAETLLQPGLRLAIAPGDTAPALALTLDACDGKADHRIIDLLVTEKIPATIFTTARWLKRNPDTVKLLVSHPDLFEIENHGARHLPAVDQPVSVYGLKAAGSPAGVTAEIAGGAAAVQAATGKMPHWYRGATALYTAESLKQIAALHHEVAGYSIAADGGARFSAGLTEKTMLAARAGDVLLAHVNHPEKAAGAGVVKALLALKGRGYRFVRLADARPDILPPKHVVLNTPAITPPLPAAVVAAAPKPASPPSAGAVPERAEPTVTAEKAALPPCPEVAHAPGLGPARHPGLVKKPVP